MTRIPTKHQLDRSKAELERIAGQFDKLAARLTAIAAKTRSEARLTRSDTSAALHDFSSILDAVYAEGDFQTWLEAEHGLTKPDMPKPADDYFPPVC